MKGYLISLFIFFCNGIIILTPASSAGVFPHYSMLNQVSIFENSQPSIWNKNYSVVQLGGGCGDTIPNAASGVGKIFVATGNENGFPCTLQSVTEQYNQFNPIGYIFTNALPTARAYGMFNPYFPVSLVKPVWQVGWDFFQPSRIASRYPYNPVGITNPNCTLTLDYPYHNPIADVIHYPGWGQIYLFSLSIGLLTMIFSAVKIGLFVFAEGKFRLSIAQAVLVCSFLVGFFFFLEFGIFGSNVSVDMGIVPVDVSEAILYIPYGFCFTSVVILAFYFGEIARLTSAQTVAGLDKMKIPAIIFVAILWAVVISQDAYNATDPIFYIGFAGGPLQDFFWAWLAIVVPFAITILLVWGSTVLLIALRSSQNKGPVIKIVVVAAVTIAFMWGLIFPAITSHLTPSWSGIAVTWGDFTVYNYVQLRVILWGIGYCGIAIMCCLLFSVSTQKEIEISKSGTSSTKSASASSASSSSSSSNDPVIEL